MTWTYGNSPNTNNTDAVRFLAGDVDTADQLVTNEEITYVLAQAPNNYLAAALVCDAIAAKYSRQADRIIGDLSLKSSQQSDQYAARAAQLRSQGSLGAALPYAGGIRISDKDVDEEDTDLVRPAFRRDLFEQPGTGPNDDTDDRIA